MSPQIGKYSVRALTKYLQYSRVLLGARIATRNEASSLPKKADLTNFTPAPDFTPLPRYSTNSKVYVRPGPKYRVHIRFPVPAFPLCRFEQHRIAMPMHTSLQIPLRDARNFEHIWSLFWKNMSVPPFHIVQYASRRPRSLLLPMNVIMHLSSQLVIFLFHLQGHMNRLQKSDISYVWYMRRGGGSDNLALKSSESHLIPVLSFNLSMTPVWFNIIRIDL